MVIDGFLDRSQITGYPEVDFEPPEKSGGLNRSMQHWLEVYSREFQSLKFSAGVD